MQIPTVLDSCSFAQVDPKALSDIEKVYRVRNIVAHTGQICYIEGGAEIKVEPQEILRFIRSAQMGIEWLSIL